MFALRFAKTGRALAVLVLPILAPTLCLTPAGAAPGGDVIAVIQASHAEGDSGNRMLDVASPIYSGDRIVTGAIGETQIKFRDNTRLVVGPNSTMLIDAFVFNDNNTARQVSIEAVTGAFRFIPASAARTPTRSARPRRRSRRAERNSISTSTASTAIPNS
ncbi:MAG TPA: FecR domain-containing protein [Bauldia sp.]